MQFHRFDLNLLIALDTLLREKNITRAAEKVFVSQPAMSAALHRLRDYFDDPLLVRVGRDMELSPRGQSLVDPVREALLLIQTALGSQPTFTAATTQREFTLIMSEEAVPDLLPAITERVSTDAPGIRISIELVSHRALSRLEYGDADLDRHGVPDGTRERGVTFQTASPLTDRALRLSNASRVQVDFNVAGYPPAGREQHGRRSGMGI